MDSNFKDEVRPSIRPPDNIVQGSSSCIKDLLNTIQKVSQSPYPVYIHGPTGSGKEWVANLLHSSGLNPDAPIMDINCSTIAEELIESLLFGHVKGAFTGAHQQHDGYFSLVKNGTLFLDEIGELPLHLQPKLLRVLETGQFRAIGATHNQNFKGRIVVATHRDLEAMVEANTFREDLFHRINVINLTVPPLSQRKEDIPFLIAHFALEQKKTFTDKAISLLTGRNWPGNVRELRNTVLRMSILSESSVIDADFIHQTLLKKKETLEEAARKIAEQILCLDTNNTLALIERTLIQQALNETDGNKQAAAKKLGVHRKTIERKLNNYNEVFNNASTLVIRADAYINNNQYYKAIELLREARAHVIRMPDLVDIDRLRTTICIKLGTCLRNIEGWASEEAISCYEEAHRVSLRIGDTSELSLALLGIWAAELVKLNLSNANETALRFYQLGIDTNNDAILASALMTITNTTFWTGELERTSAALEEYFFFRQLRSEMSKQTDFDPYPICLEFKCVVEILQGNFAAAELTRTALVAYTLRSNNDFVKVTGQHALVWIAHLMDDKHSLQEQTDKLLSLSNRSDFSFYNGFGHIFSGEHLSNTCDYHTGQTMMVEAFNHKMHPEDGRIFSSYFHIMRGNCQRQNNDWDALANTIQEANEVIELTGERVFKPLIMLLEAQMMLHRTQEDDAIYLLDNAWQLAEKQNLRFMLLKISHVWLNHPSLLNHNQWDRLQYLESSFSETDFHPNLTELRNNLAD
ncbi:sigma-54 dependent transcriptional regulator [Enterovibrio makurazakiensis]|uniref:sigma 54-interacting transcriptional regulator n=1 Tax=Enterovibrio makurazakiensis TaxID=2910232 RepID=UPI003D1F9BC1